jgi:hypothetical protein
MVRIIAFAALAAGCHGLKLAFAPAAAPAAAPSDAVAAAPAVAKKVKASAPKETAPVKGDSSKSILPKGHFYNAKGCSDCTYKASQCGCGPAMEYLACVTKHCHKATDSGFMDKCVAIENKCFDELDVRCHGPDAYCMGKFNQLPEGGLGITLNLKGAAKDAFCGPYGKCIGKMHMAVDIHKPSEGAWLECGLPKVAKASIDKKDDWETCVVDASGKDTATCDIDISKVFGAANGGADSYCVLKRGKDGEKITLPAWQTISNVHKA